MAKTMVMEGPDEFKTIEYTPTCKFGFDDCIYDDAYIKTTYPKWYKDLCERKGLSTCEVCTEANCQYDDEDK